MRTIETHKTNAASEALVITALDEPGPGGANHHYEITGFNGTCNPPLDYGRESIDIKERQSIMFQNGAIPTAGVNGITSEALLAILIDRHTGFANGPYQSEENAHAVNNMQIALDWLHQRTRSRQARGVEGKLEK